MGWFGWRNSREQVSSGRPIDAGPEAILGALDKSVPEFLERVDHGDLIYPACQRNPTDVEGDVRSIWEHTRIEAMRYVLMVPRREDEWLIDPARQPEMLDAFLRRVPHENTIVDFTGVSIEDFVIAIFAGLNWLNHCAILAGVDRDKFSGTQRSFRKVAVVAQQWWALEGSMPRCHEMLARHDKPPLMLYLIWLEYTQLAKEIATAAMLRSSTEPAQTRGRREFKRAAPTETMAQLERARDPEDLRS